MVLHNFENCYGHNWSSIQLQHVESTKGLRVILMVVADDGMGEEGYKGFGANKFCRLSRGSTTPTHPIEIFSTRI